MLQHEDLDPRRLHSFQNISESISSNYISFHTATYHIFRRKNLKLIYSSKWMISTSYFASESKIGFIFLSWRRIWIKLMAFVSDPYPDPNLKMDLGPNPPRSHLGSNLFCVLKWIGVIEKSFVLCKSHSIRTPSLFLESHLLYDKWSPFLEMTWPNMENLNLLILPIQSNRLMKGPTSSY